MATERFEIVVTDRGTRTVKRNIEGIGKSAGVTRKALAFMRAALVVVASVRVIKGLLDVADAFTTIRNRLKLVTSSMAELNTVQNTLFKLSKDTRTSFEANVTLFSRMARATLKLKLTFADLLEVTRSTALAVKISAAETQEARNAIVQFAQGMAAGALAGDELRSVVEQLPRLADAIGREFGKAGGELRSFNKANPGILTTERIVKALRAELGILTDEFGQTVPTIADGFTILGDAITLFIGGVNDATGAGRILNNFLVSIAENLDKVVLALLALAALAVFNIIVGQVALLNARILALASVTIGLGGTLVRALGAVLVPVTLVRTAFILLGRAVVFAFSPVKLLARIALGAIIALIAPVQALKIAFLALGRVILANPLFLIGAAVVGTLVAAFFIFEEEIKSVIDSLGGLGEIFDDVVTAGIAAVKTLIEAWRQFPAAVADLAIQAANGIISGVELGVNGAIELLNKLPGIDITPTTIGRFENQFAGAASRISEIFRTTFAEIKREGGGVEFVKDKFQELLDIFEQFTGRALEIDPALLQGLPTIAGGLPEGGETVEALKSKFQSLLASISPLARASFALAKAQETINAAEKAGIDLAKEYGLTNEEVFRRVTRDIIGVGNATTDFADKQKLLNSAVQEGKISFKEFEKAVRESRIALLEEQDTAGAGFERFFLKMQASAADTATQVEDALTSAFQNAEDALIDFLETGKFSFRDFVSSILADITRLAFRQTITQQFAGVLGIGGGGGGLLGSLFGGGATVTPASSSIPSATPGATISNLGGGGNILDKAVGGISSLFGFANGGSFQVGGVGGIDRNVLSVNDRPVARVSRGETVNVSPSGAAAGEGINIVFNVSTPDANSFQRSQGQIMSKIGTAINRAQQRNN